MEECEVCHRMSAETQWVEAPDGSGEWECCPRCARKIEAEWEEE